MKQSFFFFLAFFILSKKKKNKNKNQLISGWKTIFVQCNMYLS